ncbi:ATP-binding protein [Desulfobulbus rhabdoformis]|uniref:ATP-binding protein n=1 Tax=Desulfobulbus rhabdoformis TaxID=34032 RepID=UPI0019651A2D|nr:ATP-binding protein [Desulfobulbus rhabdoformis]MBM9615259.1 ATP-binding protein [Desulfobulbus rhabdoformis]
MSKFALDQIKLANEGWKAQKILLYGTQGLGKSTFGTTFENPILLPAEDGGSNLNVPAFPLLHSMSDLSEACQTLYEQEHQFKTAIMDSVDWLEPMVWAATCQRLGFDSIEAPGYGKGYLEADSDWREVMGYFDALRLERGMNIVLVAHSEVKRYDSPDTDPYDRYGIKLHKRAFALWQEWADMVLFCGYKTKIKKTEVGFNKEVSRGEGTGERMIYTEERPAYLAKNRWGLSPEIYIGRDKTWGAFHRELNKATNGRYELPEALRGE